MSDEYRKPFNKPGRIKVILEKKPGPQGEDVNVQPPGHRNILSPAYNDEDDLIPPKQGITFYDLGTRVNEDGSYSHVAFPSFVHANTGRNAALMDTYNAAMLDGDWAKAKKLGQVSQWLYTDAVFVNDTGELDEFGDPIIIEDRVVLGDEDTRPTVPALSDPDAPNATPSEIKWSGGQVKFNKSGNWDLKVESAWFYNEFEPNDAGSFILTTTPDPGGPAPDGGEVFMKKGTKIYLTPRFIFDGQSTGGPDFEATYRLARTEPVLPDMVPDDPFTYPRSMYFTSAFFVQAHATSAFWDYMFDYYATVFVGTSAFLTPLTTPRVTAAGMTNYPGNGLTALVAIIVQGANIVYVWRFDTLDSLFWHENRILRPA